MMGQYKIQHNPTFRYPYRLFEWWDISRIDPGKWIPIGNYATLLGAKRAMFLREVDVLEKMVPT